jgi:hypothetical protein
MVYSVVTFIAAIYWSIVAFPAIAVDGALWLDFILYDLLERLSAYIRNNLSVDFALTLQSAKDDDSPASSTTTPSSNPPRTKVAFIYLNFAR